ncbi:MAG: EAL domain-containing protein [Xenococcaceae cyanobacterium MO_167.B52]|nr:EAL domain-containing protein [Xenococcaceae cyanobacterium MO_167.B52]
MKIAQKLSLGFLSTSFVLAILGGFTLQTNLKIKNETDIVVNHTLKETENLTKIVNNLLSIDDQSHELYINVVNNNNSEEINYSNLKSFRDLLLDIEQKLSDSEQSEFNNQVHFNIELQPTEPSNLAVLKQIKKEFFIYQKGLEEYLNLLSKDPQLAYQFYFDFTDKQLENNLLPLLKEYQDSHFQKLKSEALDVEDSLSQENFLICLFILISISLALGLGLIISESIAKPIKHLEKTASEITKGKLNTILALDTNREDELGLLAQSFNEMVHSLKSSTVSRSFLDNILNSMLDSLIVVNMQGEIQKVNQATLHLLGYEEEELIGIDLSSILPNEWSSNKAWYPPNFIGTSEINYISKDSREIPVAFSSSFILNEQNEAKGIVCLARDVTEKHLAEKALKESEERYALASRATNDGLWDWNLRTGQIYFSPRWKFLLGYEEHSLTNSPDEWFKRVHPEYLEELSRLTSTSINNSSSHFEISYLMMHKDGSYRWMLCRGIAVPDAQGEVYRLTGSQADITNSRQAIEQLRHDALHDKLTSLPNRAYFLEELRKTWENARSYPEQMFAVIFLDLDRFKYINDSLGHEAGDQLLVEFARRIQTCLSRKHFFARLGGDEFTILVRNINYLDDVTQLAEIIHKQLQLPFYLQEQEQEIFVSSSMGIVMSDERYQQVEELLRDADTAMYQAKAAGKGRYQIFELCMYQKVKTILGIENDLRRALEKSELVVFYQPIVELDNGKISGFEALVRWLHPKKGMIEPGDFISIAEETGLIVPLGWYILEQACSQMYQWQKKYQVARSMSLSVNMSPVQLKQLKSEDNTQLLSHILHKTGLKPKFLNLEITESTVIGNLEEIVPLLKKWKNLGLKLSVDDFGTGYSSLSYLHSLPIDTLKIDRTFINQINLGSDHLELVKTIVNLANKMNLKVIAEGVETMEQVTTLKKLDCCYGQGYLFSKPINCEGIKVILETIEQINKGQLYPY